MPIGYKLIFDIKYISLITIFMRYLFQDLKAIH